MSHGEPSRSAVNALNLATPEMFQQYRQALRQPTWQRYLFQCFVKCPWLMDADVFAHRDYQRQNPPQEMIYEGYRAEAGLVGLDLPKCNERAAALRQEGNQLFVKKSYLDAIVKYNESICWARGDSEDLGIGFANRSAIYYERHEYEFALANIKLAKQHNYPPRLMSKLEARERNCREKIAAGENACSYQCPKLTMHVEANPAIPFLANGVTTAEFPRFGRGLKAEKGFKVGDVILQERPTVVAISPEHKCYACHHCGSENYQSLIPCPHCVSVMFCSEECVKNSWKELHRFECGIYDKLSSVPFVPNRAGSKIFFYGLTQLNDSVKDMMEYCKENGRDGNNPFELDWTRPNPLETFKQFHTAKVRTLSRPINHFNHSIAALLHGIYLEHPLIKSLFVDENQRNFLLESLDDYMLMATQLNIGQWNDSTVELFTLASVFNHSCDPNAHAVYCSGMLKVIVIRPIRKGDQICVQYAFEWKEDQQGFDIGRRRTMGKMDFDCVCEVCDPNSAAHRKRLNRNLPRPRDFPKQFKVVRRICEDEGRTNLDKLNAAQQFLQRYAHVHPLTEFRVMIAVYQEMLQNSLMNEMLAQVRQRALEVGI